MRGVDLFAGCGGLSLGLQHAGFEVVAALDAWETAIECYRANFDHDAEVTDLSDVKGAVGLIEAYQPDVIAGGPPCQDFSQAGKRSEGDRASLTRNFAQIVSKVRTPWFIMENVDRAQHSQAYQSARRIFKRAGYGLSERVLHASKHGVPQLRRRFFCIGGLDEKDGFLNHLLDVVSTPRPLTVREYMGDEIGCEIYYRHPRNYSRRAIYSIDEPAPTMRGVNRPVPKGYRGHPGDRGKVTRSLRPLTTYERSRIQTFPPDFEWVGARTACEQMIGNAVPVQLARFVGVVLMTYILDPEQRIPSPGQEQLLYV